MSSNPLSFHAPPQLHLRDEAQHGPITRELSAWLSLEELETLLRAPHKPCFVLSILTEIIHRAPAEDRAGLDSNLDSLESARAAPPLQSVVPGLATRVSNRAVCAC